MAVKRFHVVREVVGVSARKLEKERDWLLTLLNEHVLSAKIRK